MGAVDSPRARAVRGTAALLIIAVLLFFFSTGLFVYIHIFLGLYVGDLIVLVLVLLFIVQAEKLTAPLSSVISSALSVSATSVTAVVRTVLRLLEVAVAYHSLRRIPLQLLPPMIGEHNAAVLYDATFLIATCVVIYGFVKALAR